MGPFEYILTGLKGLNKLSNADLILKINVLADELRGLQSEYEDIQEENNELKKELATLKGQNQNKVGIVYNSDDGLYWKNGDKVPYCPSCYENNRKEIHLNYVHEYKSKCPVCGEYYTTDKEAEKRVADQMTEGYGGYYHNDPY